MVAWRVFRAIIDPANRTVLQLMTSRYRQLLLVNGACVARLTCVSLCQFKELVRCTARFLTFHTLPNSLSFAECRHRSSIFLISHAIPPPTTAIASVRDRGLLSRLYRPGYISVFQIDHETPFPRFSVSAFPPLSREPGFFADFSDCAARYPIQRCIRARVFANTLLRVRTPRNDSRAWFRWYIARRN